MKQLSVWLGPILACIVAFSLNNYGWGTEPQIVAGVTVLCAIWWMFEPIPIPVTSLIPVAVFLMTGALAKEKVAMAYGHFLIILLMDSQRNEVF